MRSSDLHIMKQRHQKKVTEIAHLVAGLNNQEIADAVINACNKASKALVEQRKIVYKDLENFDYNIDVDHKKVDVSEESEISSLNESTIRKYANEIVNGGKGIDPSRICNEMTNEKFKDAQSYIELDKEINDAMKEIQEAFIPKAEVELPEESFEHELTQTDIDNNPDLKEEGLKAGDVITAEALPKDEIAETITEALQPVEEVQEKAAEEADKTPMSDPSESINSIINTNF